MKSKMHFLLVAIICAATVICSLMISTNLLQMGGKEGIIVDDWLTLDLVAEYDSLDFNLGFIASLWHDRVEAMFDLQSFRYVSFGLRYKMCLRNY